MIRRSLETVATSNADDAAAYRALEDVSRITEHLEDVWPCPRPHGQLAADRIPRRGSNHPANNLAR